MDTWRGGGVIPRLLHQKNSCCCSVSSKPSSPFSPQIFMSNDPTHAHPFSPASCDPSLPTPTPPHGGCSHPPLPLYSPPAPQRSPRIPNPPPSAPAGPWSESSLDSYISLEKETSDMRTPGTKEGLQVQRNISSSYNISAHDIASSKSNPHCHGLENGQVVSSTSNPHCHGLENGQVVSSKSNPHCHGLENGLRANMASADTGTTHGSINLAGKRSQMINGNHLLNFQYLPISRPQPRVNPPRKPRKVQPYNKDLFLQANFKFVVLDSGEQATERTNPDNMLRWEDVVCVRHSTPSAVHCPICFESPLSPQITSCGHIFCFPCIIRYLLMGEEDHRGYSWKKCPLCFTMISSKELCTIYIDNVKNYHVGDMLEFSLLARAKDSLQPAEKVPQLVSRTSDKLNNAFSKFTITSDVDLAVHGARSELNDWLEKAELGLVDDIEQLPYVSAALDLLDDRKKHWGEQQIKTSSSSTCFNHASERTHNNSSSCVDGINVPASKTSESLNEVCNRSNGSNGPSTEGSVNGEPSGSVISTSNLTQSEDNRETKTSVNGEPSGSVISASNLTQSEDNRETKKFQNLAESRNDVKESYNFYQAVDGQLLILHPLNMKCLLHHFGSYNLLPPRICGKILQLETVTQSVAMRRRYCYLSHFPLTTIFQMCEIDMSEILPPDALTPFVAEIMKRQKEREKIERKENEAKAKAAEAELPNISFNFHNVQLSSSTGAPFSMDDFKALGDTVLPSRSPPVSGGRKRFSDVTRLGFAAAHDSPSLALKQPSNNSQVSGSESNLVSLIGTRPPAKLSFANVISTVKTSNYSERGKAAAEIGKKGKRSSRVILSNAGGRRY